MRPLAPLLAVALIGCNQPPSTPGIAIDPAEPTTIDTLVASVTTPSVDPNARDEVGYSYVWAVDGTFVDDLTGPEVPPERTERGQTWTVSVVPSDGSAAGEPASASVTIGNATPTADLRIVPEQPLSTDPLEVVITLDDPDGDSASADIRWLRDGEPTGLSGPIVPADRTTRAEVWTVEVTPRDAREVGETVTASVTIENQPPVVDEVVLRPALAYEGSRIEPLVTARDHDGDALTLRPTWSVNGVALPDVTDMVLTGEHFDRYDVVQVEITANDGVEDSEPVASGEVTILNTPPAVDTAAVTPAEATESSTLSCAAEGWSDPDGDPQDVRVTWQVEGRVVSTEATLDGTHFDKGDAVTCTLIPWDGLDEGVPVTSPPIRIANTPPVVATATISPTDPTRGTPILATVTGVSDDDGDAVTLDVDWYVDGTKVLRGASLPGTGFEKGQSIQAWVIPNDGDDVGTTVKSNTLTAVNSPPAITSFAMSPAAPTTEDAVTVAASTSDADGDSVTLEYTWTIDGTRYGSTATTSVPASATTKGDVIALSLVADDGDDESTASTGSVTVRNTPPTKPTVVMDPTSPEDGDDLQCRIATASTDADRDTLTYTFAWEQDGSTWAGRTSTTARTGDTILAADTGVGETWTCTVSVSDGDDTVTATAEATVGGGVVPGFSGERGPTFTGWTQCEGYKDRASVSGEVPAYWADDCDDSGWSKTRLVCGASTSSYRYIDVNRNVFYTLLNSYGESGLITAFKDQSGRSYSLGSNRIWGEATSGSKRDPQGRRSWWVNGYGCGESNLNLTINNSCSWEVSNCFGQGLSGDRYLWVYVAK